MRAAPLGRVCSVLGLAALWGAVLGCESDVTTGAGGGGGASVSSVTASSVTSSSSGSPGCGACPSQTPICVDDTCVAMCPAGETACNTEPGSGSLSCCGASDQCCPGLGGGFICAPDTGDGCPTVCPDGSLCPNDDLCQLDVVTGSYGCIADELCQEAAECGSGVCCPLGSRCDGGECPLPDLSIDEAMMQASARIVRQTFSDSSCSLMEGCLGASGQRKLLKFDLGTPNLGEGDLFLGDPNDSDLFEWSSCHDHFHFKGYASYELLDANDQVVGTGEKQAFCLLDFSPWSPNAPNGQYHCGFQGISRGWSDIYSSELPCQWIDITDVPAGSYTLLAHVNFDQILAESDYSNNVAMVPLVIEPETCASGCGSSDAACCGDTDTCGWAGNGLCDCDGFQPWDFADCAACTPCTLATTCEGGCTPASDPCCDPGNPCALGQDGICQCAGTMPWDAADCAQCVSADADCGPVDSCPGGCSGTGSACCNDPGADACGWSGDGQCDCGGIAWDFADCSSCSCAP